MTPYVRRFIRSSLFWLGVGVVLGVLMTAWPAAVQYRAAHMHANLLGFVSMMIFGVAYHVIPRFSGAALRSEKLAYAHVWIANAGLALMVAGFLTRAHGLSAWRPVLIAGGLLSAAGAFLFIYNIWRTLDAAPRPIFGSR
ncbi:MAG TPA: cbb3-type cytochrome c oxidase subunit I [Longimicrobiales bacterium]